MAPVSQVEEATVRAAADGDPQALDEMIKASLPLVYTIVGQALDGAVEVDDAVRDTMLIAVRDLGELRDPGRLWPWLAGIAVRRVGVRRERRRADTDATADATADAADAADPASGFAARAVLTLGLSGQHREVIEAGRWLDLEDRVVLALWSQEVSGRLSRDEVCAALGLQAAGATVRIQRMRSRLDAVRSIVAALAAHPPCADLDDLARGWDGNPAPAWRDRFTRHLQGCPACRRAADGRVPAEELLAGLELVPLPPGLSDGLPRAQLISAAHGVLPSSSLAAAAGATRSRPSRVVGLWATAAVVVVVAAGAVAAVRLGPGSPSRQHPSAAAAAATSTATSTASQVTAGSPDSAGPSATTSRSTISVTLSATSSTTATTSTRARATVPAGTVPLGSWSLESVDAGGDYLGFSGDVAALASPRTADARRRATLRVVPGLADSRCVTFRAFDGRYLRHSYFRLRLDSGDGTDLFRQDSTFCPEPGATSGSVTLRPHNYPTMYLHHRGAELWIEVPDGRPAFAAERSFLVRPALAG